MEYQFHNDHALVVLTVLQLSSFIPAGLIIANENVDLPYFDGPTKMWTISDYQCRSGTASTYIISSD